MSRPEPEEVFLCRETIYPYRYVTVVDDESNIFIDVDGIWKTTSGRGCVLVGPWMLVDVVNEPYLYKGHYQKGRFHFRMRCPYGHLAGPTRFTFSDEDFFSDLYSTDRLSLFKRVFGFAPPRPRTAGGETFLEGWVEWEPIGESKQGVQRATRA